MLNRDMYLRKLLLLSLIAAGISSCGDVQLESGTAAVEEMSPRFEDQVADGAELYATNCAACHGTNLEGSTLGPLLSGYTFVQRWGTQTPALLLGNIQSNMPPGGNENISEDDYLNIVAHILNVNGVDTVSEALTTASNLSLIHI